MAAQAKEDKNDVRIYPQKNLLPFKREDYIRQPNSVSRMEYKMELLQLRAFARFLEKLEPFVLKLISRYNDNINGQNVSGLPVQKLSIFDLEESKAHINSDGEFEVHVPYKDLGISWGYYARAKDIVENMSKLNIRFFQYEKGVVLDTVTSVFTVRSELVNGQKRAKIFRIAVKRSVLDQMVDVSMGYRDQLKRIAFVASNIYTARLYVFVSAHMKSDGRNSFEVPIDELRNFLDLYTEKKGERSIKYPRYCDLKRRVLDPAVKELKELADNGNSDFWIEITPLGSGPNGNPLRFGFKVHYSALVCDLEMKKEQQKEDMELKAVLTGRLKQTPSNLRKIQQRLTPEMKAGFRKEAERLAGVIEKRTDIENVRAFAWSSLDTWIEDHRAQAEEIKEAAAEADTGKAVAAPVQADLFAGQMQEDTDERWTLFMDDLKKTDADAYATWLYPLEFASLDETYLTIKVPNMGLAHILTEKFNEILYRSARKIYGPVFLRFVC